MPHPSRRALLLLPLLLAACAGEAPPLRTSFPPLDFDYLLKLPLDVAEISLAPPPPPGPLAADDPVSPILALQRMAQERLVAAGRSGRAVFTIDQADITRTAAGLDGSFAVRLEVFGADGKRRGFAEARVARTVAGAITDLRGTLYDMTDAMMRDMNVEFEYQVRRSLKDILQEPGAAPPPPPVQQQPLSPPGGVPPAGGGAAPPGA